MFNKIPRGPVCEGMMCVHAYNIIQVNVGSSLNELLYYLQIALLCRHHEGSLSILKKRRQQRN